MTVLPELVLAVSALGFGAGALLPGKRSRQGVCKVRPLPPLAALTLCAALLALLPLPHPGPTLPNLPGCSPDTLAQYGKVLLALAFFLLQVAGACPHRGQAAGGPSLGRASLLVLFLLALMIEVEATNLWLLVGAFVCATVTQNLALAPEGRRGHGVAARRRCHRLGAGVAAAAFMALGAGYLLGLCNTSECGDIARCPAQPDLLLLRLAALLFLALGPFLQLGIPPLHLWLPVTHRDRVVANSLAGENAVGLALLPGAAALIVLIRLLPLLPPEAAGAPLLAAPGLAALWFGALGALAQKRVQGLFIFLAIAQTGGVVLTLTPSGHGTAGTSENAGLALYALLAETLALCAAALALACCPRPHHPNRPNQPLTLRDLQGLAFREPLLTGMLTWALAALAALPPFPSFMARFLTLTQMAQTGQGVIALLAALGSLPALGACLRVLRPLYNACPPEGFSPQSPPLPALALGVALILGLILLGMLPAKCLTFLAAVVGAP